jgi:hypothetical protein
MSRSDERATGFGGNSLFAPGLGEFRSNSKQQNSMNGASRLKEE